MKTQQLVKGLLVIGLGTVLLALLWAGLCAADTSSVPRAVADAVHLTPARGLPTQTGVLTLPIAAAAYESFYPLPYVQPIPFVAYSPEGLETVIYIQNPNPLPITVSLDIFAANVLFPSLSITIPSYGIHIWSQRELTLSSGIAFSGSAFVDSGPYPAAYMVRVFDNSGKTEGLMAYTPPPGLSADIIVPAVYKEYGGWCSILSIQNTEVYYPTGVDIRFIATDGTEAHEISTTLPPLTNYFFDTCKDDGIPSGFHGWVHISATNEAIAAVVINRNSLNGGAFALTGQPFQEFLTWGVLPWVVAGGSKEPLTTEYTLHHLETTGTSVTATVEYYAFKDGLLDAVDQWALAPGASITRSLADVDLPALPWHGVAVFSSTVSLAGYAANSDGHTVAGYGSSAILSDIACLPYLSQSAHKQTNILIWNADMSTRTVGVSFYDLTGNPAYHLEQEVAPYGAWSLTKEQLGVLGSYFLGSAVITSTGSIAVVAVETISGLPPKDTYEPNDLPDLAYTIQPGPEYWSYLSHEEDLDWYRIEVTQPAMLTVTSVSYTHLTLPTKA